MKNEGKRVLFTGYAKLPAGIPASEVYKVIGLTVIVDIESGDIVEADCTLTTGTASRFVANALIGYSLKKGPEPIIRLVDDIYQGGAKKAIITALRIVYDKYRAYGNNAAAGAGDQSSGGCEYAR